MTKERAAELRKELALLTEELEKLRAHEQAATSVSSGSATIWGAAAASLVDGMQWIERLLRGL